MPSFVQQLKSYPKQFWVANTMEIFERLSWYGWFTVAALYITGSVETGGLGFSTEMRGALMGIVPFFLYLFPIFTGAMADRFGYKRSFITAYLVMILAYFLLGKFTSLPSFFLAFMFVAIGAAIFKPVVVGTVAKVTDDSNSALGFGIFYMMVNIGGFAGPIVAGKVRGLGWEYVFYACSAWAVVNLAIVLTLYKEPPASEEQRNGSVRKVFDNMVEVLGNVRFFLTVFIILFALMFANLRAGIFANFTWTHCAYFAPGWIVLNIIWDMLLPKGSGTPVSKGGEKRNPLARRMHCSNWRFAVFLLIMSGFWTSFNQIFITMPEYIRDFTETRPAISVTESLFGDSDATDPDKGPASVVATINPKERAQLIERVKLVNSVITRGTAVQDQVELWPAVFEAVAAEPGATDEEQLALVSKVFREAGVAVPGEEDLTALRNLAFAVDHVPDPVWESDGATRLPAALAASPTTSALSDAARQGLAKGLVATSVSLLDSKVRVSPGQLLVMATDQGGGIEKVADQVMIQTRQFNPEFIVNIDALSIVLLQVIISLIMSGFHRFNAMIIGMFVAAVGIGLPAIDGTAGMIGAGGTVWIVAAALVVFAIGEMMASPTSQEYVGRIAPANKKALYMGYYFVAIALGNLFGGILSGELYGALARDMQRPDLMWLTFGGIMTFTAVVFILYNMFALPKDAADSLTAE